VIFSDDIKKSYVNNSKKSVLIDKKNNSIFNKFSKNVKKEEKVNYSDNFI
jgi:hypothetical protein